MKYSLALVFVMFISGLKAQYFQFSQYNFTQNRVNPAYTTNGQWSEITAIYRNQKAAGNSVLNSSYFSATYPLLTNKYNLGAIGVSFLDDRSGIGGSYRMNDLSLSYGLALNLTSADRLSIGAQVLYRSFQLSLSNLNTGAQYLPNRGFDSSLSNGENFDNLNSNFLTSSFGILWQRRDKNEDRLYHFGVSFFDFNQPESSLLTSPSQLAQTIVVEGGMLLGHTIKASFYPEILFTSQAQQQQLVAGGVLRYALQEEETGSSSINGIIKYATGGYGILGLQWEKPNLIIGVSYDVPLTNIVSNQGSIEFGLKLRNLIGKNQKEKERVEENRKRTQRPNNIIVAKDLNESDSVGTKAKPDVEKPKENSQVIHEAEGKAEAGKITKSNFVPEKVYKLFNFGFDEAQLQDDDKDYLKDISELLKAQPALKIKISGHTDDRGQASYNLQLSEQRIRTVKSFLIDLGIDGERITTEAKGEAKPTASNSTEEGRAQNRRVEFMLYY